MTAVAPRVVRIASVSDAQIEELAEVLIDCVAGGASVSFMHPVSREKALGFWRRVAADAATGARALLVATDDHGICGTVQLVLDQPENQPHRADVAKMLVHRRARRQGLGAALLAAVEAEARRLGHTLLTLDTEAGSAGERLYARLGWIRFGQVPGYAITADGSDREAATFFYRTLETPAGRNVTEAQALGADKVGLLQRCRPALP